MHIYNTNSDLIVRFGLITTNRYGMLILILMVIICMVQVPVYILLEKNS